MFNQTILNIIHMLKKVNVMEGNQKVISKVMMIIMKMRQIINNKIWQQMLHTDHKDNSNFKIL